MVALGAKGCNVALFAQCLTKVLEILASAVDEAEVMHPRSRRALARLCVARQHAHWFRVSGLGLCVARQHAHWSSWPKDEP